MKQMSNRLKEAMQWAKDSDIFMAEKFPGQTQDALVVLYEELAKYQAVVAALEVIAANSVNPAHTMTMIGLEEVVDANHKIAVEAVRQLKETTND